MNRLYYFLTGAFIFFAALVSCTSDSDPNSGIIPTTDSLLLRFTDTTTLVAFIEKDSTLRTDATERVLLGSYYDPIFGKTTSSFYSTFTIAQSFSDSTSTVVVDSVVLTMRYDGGYGDLSKFTGYQILQVFEVTEDIPIPPTIGYNSNTSFTYNPIPIATYGYAPQFFSAGTEPAAIRIKINPSFANRFLGATVINSINIRDYIKGIYVRIDPAVTNMQSSGQGGIAYFKLNSDVSHLNIHYHLAGNPGTLKLPMGTTSNRRINIFTHDASISSPAYSLAYTDPAFWTKLNDSTNTIASDKLYIQTMEGTRVKVKMPYLKNYLDSGKIIINRAELVIPIDNTQDIQLYALPGNIMTYTLGSDGKVRLMDDIFYTYYDSYYNPATKEYKIVISQYLQQVINGNITSVFYIDIPVLSKHTDAYRLVIHSAEHATKPLKLNLTYTRIPTL